MEMYEVTLRPLNPKDFRWTLFFMAESFSHAEEQTKDYTNDEIIKIEKDYS